MSRFERLRGFQSLHRMQYILTGTRLLVESSSGGLGLLTGSSAGCLPLALAKATEAIPVTKVLASASTASPLRFSGAPVAESVDPKTPALGFWRSPLFAEIRASGAGGNKNSLLGG